MKGAYFKQVRTKNSKYAKKHIVRGRVYKIFEVTLHRIRKTGRPRDIETTRYRREGRATEREVGTKKRDIETSKKRKNETTRTRREGRATEREGGTKKRKHEGTNENTKEQTKTSIILKINHYEQFHIQ